MLIAVASATFGALFRRGALTHLEWVEACASRLDVDGLAFALADLPRADAEYMAQVRKISSDLALVPIALDAPGLLDPAISDEERLHAVTVAAALGTPLIRTSAGPAGALPPETFAKTAAATKTWAGAAKRANVTLVVATAAGTLVDSVAQAKHVAKDVDSAWLRFELSVGEIDRERLGPRDRVLVERIAFDDDPQATAGRRAWYVLDGDGGDDPFARVGAAVEALRAADARRRLGAAEVR